MSMLRLCVIGCGDWSSRMHVPALVNLVRMQNVHIAAVCDLDRRRAEQYAGQLVSHAGLAREPIACTDAGQMLQRQRPDGVLVLVSPAVAASTIRLAASRRIPFLTEKPPAADSPTQRQLIEEVADLAHVVAYNRRYAPYVRQAKQWLEPVQPQSVTCLFPRYQRREPDFTTTAVHAIDTTRHLAGDEFARLRIEASPAGQAISYFINGWTRRGTRIDILMTPDTASAVEHYIVRSAERSVFLSFPQLGMLDVPGFVELHEGNRSVARKMPADFGIAAEDFATLGGILGEQISFCQVVRGEAESISTLANTLQTQLVREALSRLLARGGQGTIDLGFTE